MTALPADWPNRALSSFVRSGGIEWHVQQAGSGPALLLLHGTGAATHSWRDLLPDAAQHFRVIAPDLPGHGFTRGRPAGGLSLPNISRSISALLGELGIVPDYVVGHSAGAAIAIRMALDGAQPSAIAALAPALLPFPGLAQHLFPTMAKLLFVNPFAASIFAGIARQPGMVERFLERSTGSQIDPAGVAAYARLFGTSAHCAGAIAMMADWDLDPLKRALPSLDVPLLVLHGDRDAAIPVMAAREAAALISAATLEVIPGLGHLLHEEAPTEVMACLAAFFARHGAQR